MATVVPMPTDDSAAHDDAQRGAAAWAAQTRWPVNIAEPSDANPLPRSIEPYEPPATREPVPRAVKLSRLRAFIALADAFEQDHGFKISYGMAYRHLVYAMAALGPVVIEDPEALVASVIEKLHTPRR